MDAAGEESGDGKTWDGPAARTEGMSGLLHVTGRLVNEGQAGLAAGGNGCGGVWQAPAWEVRGSCEERPRSKAESSSAFVNRDEKEPGPGELRGKLDSPSAQTGSRPGTEESKPEVAGRGASRASLPHGVGGMREDRAPTGMLRVAMATVLKWVAETAVMV